MGVDEVPPLRGEVIDVQEEGGGYKESSVGVEAGGGRDLDSHGDGGRMRFLDV